MVKMDPINLMYWLDGYFSAPDNDYETAVKKSIKAVIAQHEKNLDVIEGSTATLMPYTPNCGYNAAPLPNCNQRQQNVVSSPAEPFGTIYCEGTK